MREWWRTVFNLDIALFRAGIHKFQSNRGNSGATLMEIGNVEHRSNDKKSTCHKCMKLAAYHGSK